MLDEIGPVTTPPAATAAGVALVAAGTLSAATGVQLLWAVTLVGWLQAVPWSLLILGAVAVPVGGTLARGRFWAAVAGVAVGIPLGWGGLAWFAYALLNGLLSPLAGVSALVSLVAGSVLAPLALVPTRRITAARRRLTGDGPDQP